MNTPFEEFNRDIMIDEINNSMEQVIVMMHAIEDSHGFFIIYSHRK